MGDGEEYSGLLTSKIKEISATVCRDEMTRCLSGRDNKNDIKNLQDEVNEMKTSIQEGFADLKKAYEKKREVSRTRVWDIIQLLVSSLLMAFIAYKWH